MNKSQVTNEDCMIMMSRYPDGFFDLAIVDPPYGIGISDYKRVNTKNVKFSMDKKWDNDKPNLSYINELFRVSKKQIIWGFNHFLEILPSSKGFICWHKHQNGNFSECELAWVSIGGGRFFDRAYQLDQFNKIHPTQKPTALYKWLLKNYANPKDKILDTHLGSGSSRIAAYKLGFDFYGCEIDKDYFDAQEARFSKAIAEPLFDSYRTEQKQLFVS